MSMKNSKDTIWNRTRDLPTCSAVPQPTAPPRTPYLVERWSAEKNKEVIWKSNLLWTLLRVEKIWGACRCNLVQRHLLHGRNSLAYMTQMYRTETHINENTTGTHRRPQRLSQVAMSRGSMIRWTSVRLFSSAMGNWLYTGMSQGSSFLAFHSTLIVVIMVLIPGQINPTVLTLHCQ